MSSKVCIQCRGVLTDDITATTIGQPIGQDAKAFRVLISSHATAATGTAAVAAAAVWHRTRLTSPTVNDSSVLSCASYENKARACCWPIAGAAVCAGARDAGKMRFTWLEGKRPLLPPLSPVHQPLLSWSTTVNTCTE